MADSAKKSKKKGKKKVKVSPGKGRSAIATMKVGESDCCKRIEKRVTALERSRSGVSATASPAAPHAAKPTVAMWGAKGAAGSTVDVELEKSADSPNLVRVTLDNNPAVVYLAFGEGKGGIPGATVGTFVVIQIDVTGNYQQKATIKVKGAVPSTIVIPVPESGQISESQSLLVTG